MIERVIDFLNLRHFWLKDAFEVMVLGFVFYRLLLLIKGTRAVQMVYGLIGLAFVYWITGPQLLAFETMNRLMLPLLLYVPFAIVVVFQNTIRRALTGFGANPFSRYMGSAQEWEGGRGRKRGNLGSVVYMPAIMGMWACSYVLRKLANHAES